MSSRFKIINTFTSEGKERLLHEYGLCCLYKKASFVVSSRFWHAGKFTLLSSYHAVRHGFGIQARENRQRGSMEVSPTTASKQLVSECTAERGRSV